MAFLLNSSIQDQLPQLAKKLSEIGPGDIPEHIHECVSKRNGEESHQKTLQELLHLLPTDIQKYVEDAFKQDWPFLPQKLNPTIMAEPNIHIPKLSQVELLLLSLNFALESEDYRMGLAIAFVVDRFVYWCDGSAALLNIVEHIQKLAPMIPIAPQLITRKARVMKDNGDLHGSIQILNNLLEQISDDASISNSPSRWQYKTDDQYTNVWAVCVQIKGQIYQNLGLWKEAINPLMKSIEGFQALPVADLKGISHAYVLLSRCLCRLSKKEYQDLRQEYSFQFDQHNYQAYEFGMMAYRQCPGQRLFLSKHLLQSGECLLMYTVQLTDASLQHKMFLKIMEIFNSVFYNQKAEEFSQSKDQLFIFIKALFLTCLTLGCSYNPLDRDLGNYLETICLFVYKKFCDIGANQLDSEIGRKNMAEIIPALNFALVTVSQQSGENPAGDTNDGVSTTMNLVENDKFSSTFEDFTMDTNSTAVQNKDVSLVNKSAVTSICESKKYRTVPLNGLRNEFKVGISAWNRKIVKEVLKDATEDCKTDNQKRLGTPNDKTPMVDCKAETKERLGTPKDKTPMVDCKAKTKERLGTPKDKTPMVDCEAETKERLGTVEDQTPKVDCKAKTRERSRTVEDKTPKVDCKAKTRERSGTVEDKTPMVDCKAKTRERSGTGEDKTPAVDCKAKTRERSGTVEDKTPTVDCKAKTRERSGTVEDKTPMVDCNAKTRERSGTVEDKTPTVDCKAKTRERSGTVEDKTPTVDCKAKTRERSGTVENKTPMVDCKAKTRERSGTVDDKTPMVDCKAKKRERLGSAEAKTPMVDCKARTRERSGTVEDKTPMVDCKAKTRERSGTVEDKTPMVDCKAKTRERPGTVEDQTPMVDCKAKTRERTRTVEDKTPTVDCKAKTRERSGTVEDKTPTVDCKAKRRERSGSAEAKTPIVHCKAKTRERSGTVEDKTPMVDCKAKTRERSGTVEDKTPMVDCKAKRRERLGSAEAKALMVDCKAKTRERSRTVEDKTPTVDCKAKSWERSGTVEDKSPMVDCKAKRRERLGTPEAKTPMVDCKEKNRERLVTQDTKTPRPSPPKPNTPMVDCKAETKARLGSPKDKAPMVECKAETKEMLRNLNDNTPMVDCNEETKKQFETPKNKTPMIDCKAKPRERLVTPDARNPIVNCMAETKKRLGTPEYKTPILDCQAETKDRLGITEARTTMVDCEADTQDRVPTNRSSNVNQNYDSGFESLGSSFLRENPNSALKSRIVGLPSHVSAIESKVSSLDKFCRTFDDFTIDTDSSAIQSKDASLVNKSALTTIRQSRKNGTFSSSRLLNKFQRQESVIEEPQFIIPTTTTAAEGVNQNSLSSFLGNLLLKHLDPKLLTSLTNSHLPVFNWDGNSPNQEETVDKIQKATLYQYNPVTCVWSGQDTIVCTGKELTLGKGKKGNFRNVYQITFLHQDEPLGKYVSKRYREQREPLQYMEDVVSQMQAGRYVTLFNQALQTYESDLRIHFLSAAFMHLRDSHGKVKDWINIEPFVVGEFLKLTNNKDFCNPRGKKVSTSFTHFTYVQSRGKMMVSDLQGWLPSGPQNLIYLTDPQFHTDSGDSSPFDFGLEGMKVFFDEVHPECNEICNTLKLGRPNL